jgi:hypothetical protein
LKLTGVGQFGWKASSKTPDRARLTKQISQGAGAVLSSARASPHEVLEKPVEDEATRIERLKSMHTLSISSVHLL